ncbi:MULTISPECIES: hypothetical protein [unclassified Streptomyces]|nr:hypothetical protein [Streptomyces sp. DSM 110735]
MDEQQQPETQKISLFEALADELVPTGPNMSNQSTPSAGDADDQ